MQAGLTVLACVNQGNDLIELINEYKVGAVVEGDARDERFDQAALDALVLAEDAGVVRRCRDLAMGMFSSRGAVNQIISSLATLSRA